MICRTQSIRAIFALIVVLALLHTGTIGAANSSNLALQKDIDFGHFTGKITMYEFRTDTPVKHNKASAGHKLLLISITIIKIADNAEVNSSLFALQGSKATFEKPGVWGSEQKFEVPVGCCEFIKKGVNNDMNIFFEVPVNARLEDFNLTYR